MNDFTSIYNGQQVEKAVGASFVPTLNAAPTSSTVSYTRDGNSVNFEIGQFARVAKQGGGYDFYQLYDLSTAGEPAVTTASWEKVENIHADHEDIYITVTLAADAPQDATVSGLVINAYFNDASVPTVQVTTDNNGMAALSVPNGYKYEIVFPVQQGCREIAPVVHTATLYQRSVEVEYAAETEEGEVVTVQALNKDAQVYSVLAGVTISCTYDGTTTQYTTGSDGKATFVVPDGKTYTVTAGAVEGKYVRNQAARTFTAESSVRSVTYIYSLFTSGLFVVDSGGGEYRLDEWQDAVEGGTKQNSDAKMIKVATSALANAGGIFYVSIDMLRERTGVLTGQQWASQNVEFKSIPLNGNSSSAAYYYDGLTASMLIKSEGEERGIFTPAATNALLATFELNANEIKHGFLGSVGQWNVLWSNKEEVDDILLYTRPNGTYLLSTYTTNKWTATQSIANLASTWTSSASGTNKLYSHVVVPFFA